MILVKPSFEIMALTGQADLSYSYEDHPNLLIEAAGRTCYKSEDKISEGSAEKFVRMIRSREHVSVLEHSWVAKVFSNIRNAGSLIDGLQLSSPFLRYRRVNEGLLVVGNLRAFEESTSLLSFVDDVRDISEKRLTSYATELDDPSLLSMTVRFVCDRGVTHENVRHRPASFSQESTRFCNYGKMGVRFIIPCDFDLDEDDFKLLELIEAHYNLCLNEKGRSPQQARYFLPNGLKTEIVHTADLQEWRHIFKLRAAKAAHPQMREIMVPLLKEMKKRLPIIFDDIEVNI